MKACLNSCFLMSTMYCAAESRNLIVRSCRNLSVRFRDAEHAYRSIYGKQRLNMFMREQPTRGRLQLHSNLGMRSSSHS
jgi:hypothetical protein